MKLINLSSLTLALSLVAVLNASALNITPASVPQIIPLVSDPNGVTLEEVRTLTGKDLLEEFYKADVTPAQETGDFAGSYTTTFFNTPTDPEDATIEYDGGPAISPGVTYLLVKDGAGTPSWYLFDISGWNGTEDIVMTDFWAGSGKDAKGAISHVTIYGEPSVSVPDAGGALILLGLGLFGLALPLARRLA